MRFIQSIFAGAALVAAALAVEINSFPASVNAGQSAQIKYSPADNTPVTIQLKQGASGNLKDVSVITTSATGGAFTWNVPSSLPSGKDYALFIVKGSENNYWGPFEIKGGAAVTSSAASSSGSASASASGSASTSAASASTSGSPSSIVTSVSGAPSSTGGRNGTVSSATLASTSNGGRPTGSSTTTGGPPNQTGNVAAALGSSPLALIFGAVAAFAYLN